MLNMHGLEDEKKAIIAQQCLKILDLNYDKLLSKGKAFSVRIFKTSFDLFHFKMSL